MRKVIRLTESDLMMIVKRVIKENDEDMIRIPSMYDGIRMELGKSANPNDIIEMYNELAGGTPLVDYSDGTFYNEGEDEIPLDVIFDELNYAIVGEENGDDYDHLMSQAREFLIEFEYDDPESVYEMSDMEVIKIIKIMDKELYEKIQNIRARDEYGPLIGESDLMRIVKRVINEEEEKDPMDYFHKMGGKISDDIDKIVRRQVDPHEYSTVESYFKRVCKLVWDNLQDKPDLPSKKDFMKFMRKKLFNYIENHMRHLW